MLFAPPNNNYTARRTANAKWVLLYKKLSPILIYRFKILNIKGFFGDRLNAGFGLRDRMLKENTPLQTQTQEKGGQKNENQTSSETLDGLP